MPISSASSSDEYVPPTAPGIALVDVVRQFWTDYPAGGLVPRDWTLHSGPNPVDKVKRQKVSRRTPDFLRATEVPGVLAALPDRWRPVFATALYAGLRKGEVLGLRKEDVDLERRQIVVRRSHERDKTKGTPGSPPRSTLTWSRATWWRRSIASASGSTRTSRLVTPW